MANYQEIFKDKKDFEAQYRAMCQSELGKTFEQCTELEQFQVLARLIASKGNAQLPVSHAKEAKKVYYFSLEFLIGPLLDNYLINYGIRDLVADAMKDMGSDLDAVCRQEVDPGLGNGGLGRLAACFLASMAHNGMAGYGNGMRYRYGLFHQDIEGGRQVERTDNWLANGFPWETRKDASAVTVRFNGHVVRHEDEQGNFWFTEEGGELVRAVPYDVPVDRLRRQGRQQAAPLERRARRGGLRPRRLQRRRLRQGKQVPLRRRGHLDHPVPQRRRRARPPAAPEAGVPLRLRRPADHPALLREGLRPRLGQPRQSMSRSTPTTPTPPCAAPSSCACSSTRRAWTSTRPSEIVHETVSFTNHTVMPEALEKWPINTFRNLLPRLYMFIEEIDRRWRDGLSEKLGEDGSSWTDVLRNTAILWDGQVRMANLSIIFSHSVNGVSALHSDILKRETFRDFAKLEPELFNNKTNGVTHRRFLREANPAYSKLITDAIGDGWLTDAYELEKLVPFESDASFLDAMDDARRVNKERLAAYVKETSGTVLDTNMVFDVQVKRFHAYKRQLLSVFKILDLRNRILDDANFDPQPTAFIFSGKAAQSYAFAKEVIRLINSLADVVNGDPRVNDKIRVAFVPNFAVSNAQYIYSAADISEQISLAGTEASGTSNMKLMMNGALTLGTLDGSNVEISELVGPENIKIFGMKTEEVEELQASGRYYAWDRYNADRGRLGRIVDQLTDGTLAGLSGNFESVRDHLMVENDPYLVMGDFHAYAQAWEELTSGYSDRRAWNKSALHNTAKAGFFSSDRTIAEYEADIWHIEA